MRIQSGVKLDYAQMDSNSGIKDWGKLMAAGRYGDERAYRRLLRELHNWLTRWYRRRLPTALVDDASQEALIAVHNNRNTYEPSRPFVPWLTSIVRHKGADQLRAAKRRESDPLPDDLAVGDHESAVIRESLLECLMAALKPAQAEVIRLVKLEGCTIAEASHRTGQSRSLVKINIHRGLAKMQRTAAVTDLLPMTRPRIGRARRPKRRGTRTSDVTLKAPDRVASRTDSLAKASAVARGGCGTDHAS